MEIKWRAPKRWTNLMTSPLNLFTFWGLSLTKSWFCAVTCKASKVLLSTVVSCCSSFWGSGEGRTRKSPLSTSIEVVTRKKINNMKDISAVDAVFNPGTWRFFLLIIMIFSYRLFFLTYLVAPKRTATMAPSNISKEVNTNISESLSHNQSPYSLPLISIGEEEPKRKVATNRTSVPIQVIWNIFLAGIPCTIFSLLAFLR